MSKLGLISLGLLLASSVVYADNSNNTLTNPLQNFAQSVTPNNTQTPPGLAKNGKTPPGLAKKNKVPPGWSKGNKQGFGKTTTKINRVVIPVLATLPKTTDSW